MPISPPAKFAKNMSPIDDYFLIKPDDLNWRRSNIMKIPNTDFLERTRSELPVARLWRYSPNTAGTLHKQIRAEEFYFVLEIYPVDPKQRPPELNAVEWPPET